VYSVTNTNFATFGSAIGTDGTWNTRVRSWLDQNGNSVFDEGTDLVSEWSNECQVTYNRSTSNVTVCKEDSGGNKLSGWNVSLKGELLQTLEVPPTGATVVSNTLPSDNYVLEASGVYTYRPGTAGAEYTDANYSKRHPGDAVYGGAFVPWVNVNSFPAPHTGWLGLMVNDNPTSWSAYFAPDHVYTLGYPAYAGGTFSFKILDDQYGDNSGSLTAKIFKGYAGTTGDNGCVTFTDVPYGNYMLDEVIQDDWEYLRGDRGEVKVDAENETFVLKNKFVGTGIIRIVKDAVPNTQTQFDYSLTGPSGSVERKVWEGNPSDEGQVIAGRYTLTETDLPEYTESISCSNNQSSPNNTITFDLNSGDDVTCTITNVRNVGQVTFVKTVDQGPAQPQDWSFAVYDDAGGLVADTYMSGKTYPLPTGNYTVQESNVQGYSFNAVSGLCTMNPTNGKVEMVVTENGGTCMFANTRDTGRLQVQKTVNVADDLADWEFKLDNGSWVHASNTGLVDFGQVAVGNHTITEKTQTGYYLQSVTGCTPNTANNNSASAVVSKNETTTCVFNNYAIHVYSGSNSCPEDKPVKVLKSEHTINSTDADGETLSGVIGGSDYLFEVSGTFVPTSPANGWNSDAGYTTTDSWANLNTQYGLPGTAPDYGAHALLADLGNGVGIVQWGAYNPTHVYSLYYTPTVSDPRFVIGDRWSNWYGTPWDNQRGVRDNSGSLNLKVYECVPYGSIEGFKFEDLNGNGVKDVDEPKLQGWEIKLYNETGNRLISTTSTDAQGAYTFKSILPGNYQVCETNKTGWIVTDPAAGNVTSACKQLAVYSGQITNISFGNFKLGSISGMKFEDMNNNEVKDPGDAGLAGWTIYIDTNTNGILDSGEPSTLTQTDGSYTFSELGPGNYTVREVTQSGWGQTAPKAGSFVGTVSSGASIADNDFGNFHFGEIQGAKYQDDNKDGTSQPSESLLGGWKINLYDSQWQAISSVETADTTGQYRFGNLGLGTYYTCEELKTDWKQIGPLDLTDDQVINNSPNVAKEGSVCWRSVFNQSGQNQTGRQFGNIHQGKVTVSKFHDRNTNGVRDSGEELMDNWDMTMTAAGGFSKTQTTDGGDGTLFTLDPDTYYLTETEQKGWIQSGVYCTDTQPSPTPSPTVDPTQSPSPTLTATPTPTQIPSDNDRDVTLIDRLFGLSQVNAHTVSDPDGHRIVVDPGSNKTCYVGNYQPGKIEGIKYFDNNQNGKYDEGESKMQFWGMSLTDSDIAEQKITTDANGGYQFSNLKKGTYTLCEEDRTAWGWVSTEPSKDLCRTVEIDVSGETETRNFGNFIASRMYIARFNNAWPNDQQVGDEVTYTIRVMAVGGPVTGAQVFDLPPLPFTYVPGSYTAESTERGDLKGTTTTEPVYSSPGVWNLGNLIKDEIVTLTYRAKIGSTDPGIYPDMVWATGTSEQARAQGQAESDLLALSDPSVNESIGGVNFDGSQGHFGEDNFAGTQVAVVVDQTPSADHQVAVEVEESGSVLGASTELPATGGRFWVSLVAILTVLLGGAMIYLGRKNRSSALAVALMMGLGLMLAPSAQAVTAIRIEQPYNNSAELNQDASTNQRDMKIDFVVMNTAGLSVTARCQQSKDGGGWSDIATSYAVKAGGNSGYCEAKNLDNKSNYDFRVRVSGDGADQYSSTVRVGLDTDGPGTPINYGKSKGNDCEDVIKFRTADDNQTVRVDVYRSDNAEKFTANKDSRAALITIGPKTDHTLTTSKPDCQKTYYYVVRAFDANGNGSGLVGDEVITKVIIEGESGQTQTVTVGAVPVGSAAGGSTVNPLTGQTAGGTAGGIGSVEVGTTADEDAQAAEGEEGSGLTDDESAGENGEEGSVLGETTGGGFFGWLGSLWQSFISWLKSLFGLN